jgi:hypothetical protein
MPKSPEALGIKPGDVGYGSELQAIQNYKSEHPLGSDISPNNSGWGKFEHGLSRVANIAGDALAPQLTQAIPGSDLNKALHAKGNMEWENMGVENQLKEAQTGQATAAAWKDYNNPGLLGKTNDEQDLAALMKTTNPDTGKPYTVDEANQHIKQQSQDVKPVIEQNQPVGDAGVPQHTQQLKTLEAGMTPAQAAQFEQAYSVLPTDSNAVANQRLENAKATAGMDAKERDLQTQRDIAAKNRQTQQGIAAGVHQDAENNLDATRGLESVQYVDKSGNLVSGSYNDAVAAGAEKTARKVSPEDDKTNRANYAQFGRWQGNIQKASDTMGAWDNKKDKDLAIQVLNNASASIHAGILNVDTEDLQNAFLNNADYAAMTPAGQAHMQNMFQLWSDAVNLMKVETGGVPRGEHFLKLESAILPQPEKTQAQNREALNQFSNRILQDTKGHVRPNDMDPVIPYDARAIRKDGQIVGYLDAKGKRQEF